MNDDDWGQWIRTIRTGAGLTQEGLADRIGVSRRLVLAWEAGDHVPGGKHLIGIFKACGIRLEEAPQPPQPETPPQTRSELIRAVAALAHQMSALRDAVETLGAESGESPREEASGS